MVAVRTTGGFVATTAALVGGAAVGNVVVTATVGIGVSVGCEGVAVADKGVGVMTTVMTKGGCVGAGVGVGALPQLTTNKATSASVKIKTDCFFIILLLGWQ